MIKGANSTVQVRAEAISALDVMCGFHHMTKTEFLTSIIMGLSQTDSEKVESVLRTGRFTNVLVALGGEIKYPEGLRFPDGEIKDILKGVI